MKCVSASLNKIEEEDRSRLAVRGSCSPSCKIREAGGRRRRKGYLYTGEAYTPKRRTRASVFPPFSTMFIPSGPWTALPGNDVLQYTQPKPQFPFYHGPLGGVAACDSHLLGLKGWYWAQAVAFWKAQQTMAQDNWMSGSGVDEVRYSFAFCFASMTGPGIPSLSKGRDDPSSGLFCPLLPLITSPLSHDPYQTSRNSF